MSFPRYPSYKDSGVEWLGKVPGHWEVTTLYGSVLERTESNKGMREDNLLSLSYGRIVQKDIASNDGLLPESFETYQIVRPGDIVFRLTDLQNDKRSLRSALVEETGIITSAYLAVTPRGASSYYMSYLFRAFDTTKVFYSMGGGLRQSMKFADLKRMPTLLPPLPEQTQIAAFLDRETAKIDALVTEQRRLMELLKEKRQAVISHAVARGLNPDAPLKPSGIAWLGDVPAHWEVVPLKHLCELLKDGTHLPPERVDSGIPLLSVRNLVNGEFVLRPDDSMISEESYQALCRAFVPMEQDVLLAIVGATLGKTAVIPNGLGPFHIQRSVAIFRPRTKVLQPKFLHLVFQCGPFQSLLWEMVGYSAQPGIYLGTLENIRIAVPPGDEQSHILKSISVVLDELADLTSEAQRAIDLLQERRTALIAAAVTGQIDVR